MIFIGFLTLIRIFTTTEKRESLVNAKKTALRYHPRVFNF